MKSQTACRLRISTEKIPIFQLEKLLLKVFTTHRNYFLKTQAKTKTSFEMLKKTLMKQFLNPVSGFSSTQLHNLI